MGRTKGFTLTELLVSIAILTVLVLFTARLFSSATTVTTMGGKHIEANSETRPVLDRIDIDFASMMKRADVDCYAKNAANPQPGNDQIAFFSEVPGYYPSSGSQSPISLVSYRINSSAGSPRLHKLERLAKGLVWNGVSATDVPVVFLPFTIAGIWPTATNGSADPDYELLESQVFRFEYYYRLKDGSLSATPWTGAAGHMSLSGFQDVTSMEVSIAVIDRKSRVLVSDAQLSALIADLVDFNSSMKAADLMAAWQATADTTTKIPRAAASGIRFAHRTMILSER